ncbi:MAG TPA: SBBP repeat-containing protein [Terriglobales bacterium]
MTARRTGQTRSWVKVVFLGTAMLAAAAVVFHFGSAVHAAKAGGLPPNAHTTLSSKAISIPLFFEPNQGQTAPQVKFLAHGAGYGLFLTADEAVLQLQHTAVSTQHSAPGSQLSAPSSQPASSAVIRMRLEGANPSASVSGASPLPGKSSYYIGSDRSKWRRDIPQFARVDYQAVYPGVDLVYYGKQGQLEYDFHVAPAADPSQIALSFTGASARIVPGNDASAPGDLVLATADGEVRFHAPRVYQPAAAQTGESSGSASGKNEKTIAGAFRQLAGNRIGFTIGDYDHSRELVIDPILSYSTYLGGSGTEGLVQVAVDSALNIYVAGSTNSADFPVISGAIQPCLGNPGFIPTPTSPCPASTAQNIFISKIQPANFGTGTPELVYSTYLGGSGTDSLAGIAVDAKNDIYVAGTTSSTNFPTTSNAFQQSPQTGTHGFLSVIGATYTSTSPPVLVYNLSYSTYLAGNGADQVTGLAIDTSNQFAYVTGNTTSNNFASNSLPFPANPNNAYQLGSTNAPPNPPDYPQFFATKINTTGSGIFSLIYSTYFGGGNPASGAIAQGGGIAVDSSGNMYITGTTNMLSVPGPNPGEVPFPLLNAQQACLNMPPGTTSCTSLIPYTDAYVAKINPQNSGQNSLVYSTYVGAENQDTGVAIAVDSASNAYVTGGTFSLGWVCSCSEFQPAHGGDNNMNSDAYFAKIGGQTGSVYPLTYFTYLGGSGNDVGNAIQVDSSQAAHVAGTTASPDLPVTQNALQGYGGNGDAFVALISTSGAAGDYLTYLGGSQQDQGTGIALDIYGSAYVGGNTQSSNFPVTPTGYQTTLPGPQAAFVSKIGAVSTLVVTQDNSSPSPSPVAAGTQVAFTFDITNSTVNGPGTDPATLLIFNAVVPTTGNATSPTAKVTSGTGNCASVQTGGIISCFIPTLAVNAVAKVEVDVTPLINPTPPTPTPTSVVVTGTASANGGPFVSPTPQSANVVDFGVLAAPGYQVVNAGQPATYTLNFCPTAVSIPLGGYSGTITPSQSTSPSIVTSPAPTFVPTSVTLAGSACANTALTIATVARPVSTSSLFRPGSFYAAWFPIGGLSLVGLGIGAGRRRRRWLSGAVLGLIAGMILLLPSCGSGSTSATTPGGTAAGTYTITVVGAAAAGASHSAQVTLRVN